MDKIRLVAGLGNIGPEYMDTRHNMGFLFADMLAQRYMGSFRAEKKFKGDAAKIKVAGEEVHLIKPSTYMNSSGESVVAIANFYKIKPSEILVVHDELDLPPGEVKLKKGGGHGGHNGLKSVNSHLGTQDYLRLRVGIGHPGDKNLVVGWVLKKPSKADESLITDALDRAMDVFEDVVAGDTEKAMQRLHTGN